MAVPQIPTIMELPCLLVEDSNIKEPLEVNPKDVSVLREMEDAGTVVDCIGSCIMIMGISSSYKEVLKAISNVIGREFTLEEFKKLGERVWNMERVFSVREGITRVDDTLPRRLLEEPLTEGKGKGHVAEIETLLDAYYELRGWDKNGVPTVERLQYLGLEDIFF